MKKKIDEAAQNQGGPPVSYYDDEEVEIDL